MSISDRLDQIEQRADNATEGPWWGSMLGPHVEMFAGTGSGSDPMIANGMRPGDAEFIAASRTDVPDLLAAVRAVLDACDRIDASIIPSGDFEVGQKSVTQTVRMVVERKLSTVPSAAESARAIATALGKEARNGQ